MVGSCLPYPAIITINLQCRFLLLSHGGTLSSLRPSLSFVFVIIIITISPCTVELVKVGRFFHVGNGAGDDVGRGSLMGVGMEMRGQGIGVEVKDWGDGDGVEGMRLRLIGFR